METRTYRCTLPFDSRIVSIKIHAIWKLQDRCWTPALATC